MTHKTKLYHHTISCPIQDISGWAAVSYNSVWFIREISLICPKIIALWI